MFFYINQSIYIYIYTLTKEYMKVFIHKPKSIYEGFYTTEEYAVCKVQF